MDRAENVDGAFAGLNFPEKIFLLGPELKSPGKKSDYKKYRGNRRRGKSA
jgi:hypothetical protein